jgi:phytoene desaturase
LISGQEVSADCVVMNADFGTAMTKLIPESSRPSWTDKKLVKRPFSCSTFMIYLGLKKKYDFAHHNIFFAADYKKNIEEIFKQGILPEDPSFYIQNASVTDDNLAPVGKSTIYILVPVPNLEAGIDWEAEKARYRDLVLDKIASKSEMRDIREQIEVEEIITPEQWRDHKYVYKGAVFNLAHTLGQMLYLRPHNQFEDIPDLYIVGGGTHPGSGLPTIVESGRIVAQLINER